MKQSIEYYNNNAAKYIQDTFMVDMTQNYECFLSLVPQGGKILDAGCGSGRDALAFKKMGYDVYAIDGSAEMVQHCKSFLDHKVEQAYFETYDTNLSFDGIWACASFLHIKKEKTKDIIKKFAEFLNDKGVFYLSFKYGNKEVVRNYRYFNYYTEKTFSVLINEIEELNVVKYFITQDVRESRKNEKWLNVVLRKSSK